MSHDQKTSLVSTPPSQEIHVTKLDERRKFLRGGALLAGLSFVSFRPIRAIASACGWTPPQTEGPFYPGESQFQNQNDLTRVAGAPAVAKGQIIVITGIVRDAQCRPIPNANVEIWQACVTGKYNHPNDPNTAPLDPNFRYWGETFTDAQGRYWFKTIVPGAYPAGDGWIRPPHVHYKVSALGFHELTTQMYFKGNALNAKDLILQKIPAGQRESVIVDFKPSAQLGLSRQLGQKTPVGQFDITLHSVR